MIMTLQVSLANQEVKYDLIAQEVESAEYRGRVSSTYTTKNAYKGRGTTHVRGVRKRAQKVQ